MATKKNINDRRSTPSGSVGGPGAGSGLNFQVDFAIRQALDAISQALVDPISDLQISMEPRVVTPDSSVTRWDVRLSHPERVTEVKLNPRRADILEWLDRVEIGTQQDTALIFELFYGRGATSLITAVENLCRISTEADGNDSTFRRLVALEPKPTMDTVLEHLRSAPHLSLSRIRLTPIDQQSLADEIQFRLRHLVAEPDRERLYNLLFTAFHKGIEQRATYHVRDLIKRGTDSHIEFFAPPTVQPQHLPTVVSSALYVLQHCENGLPTEVLAAGVDATVREVNEALTKHAASGILACEDECWTVGLIAPPLAHDNGLRLVVKALRHLFDYIANHKKSPLGRRQVPNAVALAKVCQSEDPELVSALFWQLDKLLKQTGNKRLVLEVANISLEAARRPPPSEAKTKGEAVALICGRAWVFQRKNRLSEARADGQKSLQLGEDIGWSRNTAFCLKCLGRLFRMEAEQHMHDDAMFRELLHSSIEYLNRAIQSFSVSTELTYADRMAEVGDCMSLLGRTHLVGGDLANAKEAARGAVDRVKDETSKDYADLQILLGDLALARHDVDAAVSFYDASIRVADTSDAETSEIAARARLRKGHATKSSREFDRAAEIWTRLEEQELADDARWHSMLLGGRVPAVAQRVVQDESASVRVEVMRQYETALGVLPSSRGRRAEPPEGYWTELLRDARKTVAIRHIDW